MGIAVELVVASDDESRDPLFVACPRAVLCPNTRMHLHVSPVAPARLWLRANDGSPVLALSSTVADVSVGPTSSGPTRSSRPGQGASGAGTAAPD